MNLKKRKVRNKCYYFIISKIQLKNEKKTISYPKIQE